MQIKATQREKTGKRVSDLRRQGLIPGVVYGQNFKNLNLSLDLKEFLKVYLQAGHASVVDLEVEGEKEPLKVLIADVQEEPIKNSLIHVDFHKIDLSQKVSAEIPLKFRGESPAVKSGAAILLHLIPAIKVEALPLDLPHQISLDVSRLENIGDALTIKDLPIDHAKVEVKGHKAEDLVVKIDYAVQIEKEEEVKSVEDIEVLAEKKEGEEGAEGEVTSESKKGETQEEVKGEKEDKKDPSAQAGKREKEKK